MDQNTVPTWEESTPAMTTEAPVVDEIIRPDATVKPDATVRPDATVMPAMPRWEDSKPVDNRIFTATQKHWRALRQTFAGEPFAFIDDSELRAGMDHLAYQSGDAEAERKKWALAAYYAQMKREDIRFCYGNLDALIERWNGGQKQSVDQAYADIATMLNPPRPGDGGAAEVAKAGGAKLMSTVNNFALTMLEGMAISHTMSRGGSLQKGSLKAIEEGTDLMREDMVGYYKDVAEKNSAAALEEDWIKHWNNGRWLINAGKFLAIEAPTMALQLTLAKFMSPLAFMATIGGSSAMDKAYDLKDDNIEMTDGKFATNVLLTGVINSGAAWITAGIVKGKIPFLNKVQFKSEIKAVISYFTAATGIEAGQEAVEQLAENTVDLHTGVHGDLEKISKEHYRELLWNGVPESAFAGGAFGLGGGAIGFKSFRQQREVGHRATSQLEAEKARLLAVENPSEYDIAALNQVKRVLDAGNINDLAATAQALTEISEARQQAAAAEITVEDALRREAEAAELNLQIRKSLPHNPEEVIDAVAEFSQGFKNTVFHVVDSAQAYPAEVLADIRRRGYDEGRLPRAFLHNGEVWLDASRVTPSEVPALMIHEVVAHKGLREVIPARHLDEFLDNVYREHYQDDVFKEVARLYFPEQQSTITEEDADYQDISLDTAEDQRYAAEEFLARIAETQGVKPSWWKEFIQKIRMALAKLPLFRDVRMTDREIETILARSARAMRRGRIAQKFGKNPSQVNTEGTAYSLQRVVDKDAEYLDAVKRGDIETAQQLVDEAARRAGYDIKAYHGTTAGEFNVFSKNSYFTENIKKAEQYITVLQPDGTNKPRLYSVYIKQGNIKKVSFSTLSTEAREILDSRKRDTTLRREGILGHADELIVKNPSQIKSADAVTYDDDGNVIPLSKRFNQEEQDIRYSLAPVVDKTGNVWYNDSVHQGEEYEYDLGKLQANHAKLKLRDGESWLLGFEPTQPDLPGLFTTSGGSLLSESDQKTTPERGDGTGRRPGSTVRAKLSPLAERVSHNLRSQGTASLVGLPVQNSADIASVCQILRDYRYETMRIIAVKDGVISEIRSASSRLPGMVAFDNKSCYQTIDRLADADQIYLVHNHPSGRSNPSRQDVGLTRQLLEKYTNIAAHVVINHNEYSVITRDGVETIQHDFSAESPVIKGKDFDLPTISDNETLAKAVRQIVTDPDTIVVIGDTSKADLAGIWEIPLSQIKNSSAERLAALIRANARKVGASRMFVGNIPNEWIVEQPYLNMVRRAIGEGFVVDFITKDGSSALASPAVEIGIDWRKQGMQFGVSSRASFKDDPNNTRYSLSDYSDADRRDIISVLKPLVGTYAEKSAADYAQYLAGKGVELPEADARYFALEAVRENMAAARQRSNKARGDWLYENLPLWRKVVDFAGGEDFKIRPSLRFIGQEFSGSWISSEAVKYSKAGGAKLKGEAKNKYLARREAKLKSAEGIESDVLAESIARDWGRDSLEVEQEIIDFFRELKKPDLYKIYTDWKKDNILGDKAAERRIWDEWQDQERAAIEDEVIGLLTRGAEITEAWIWDNRKVYQELYRQLFDGKEAPYNPGKKDLEAINASLLQQGENASSFAQAYKVAREKAYDEFMDKLRDFKERVMDSKADALKLQRDAMAFAEKNLPAANRGEFSRSIIGLLEHSTSPSGRYPEGRRMAEFRNLLDRMTRRGAEVRKAAQLEEIKEMLDAAKVKRNYKGIPTSILPSEQRRVDRIRQIINMNLPAVANLIEYNNEQITALEGDSGDAGLLENYREDNAMLELFGNLKGRTADDAATAANVLRNLIRGGRSNFKEKILARQAELQEMRNRAVHDATFGTNVIHDRSDARRHTDYILKNEALGTLMRLVSGESIQDFDRTLAGELYRDVEDSTQLEQTGLRRMQNDFDAALNKLAGIDGKNKLAKMRNKGRFFRMVSEVVENSGVFKREYARLLKTGKDDFITEVGRRQLVKKTISVEDYEWNGQTRKGARSLLNDIDNGIKIDNWGGMALDDVAVAFLRQQLADFDAGLKQSYEVFNDESDDANFNRMLDEERDSGRLVIFTHSPDEVFNTVEVPLSQGAALQILLTWEQEHYRPNLKWNGWTDESIAQLKSFIKPEVLKMGEWMRDYIALRKSALDDKTFERYGARLPINENYFPAAFRGGKTVKIESAMGRGTGTMSINPNFLIARKFHLKPVDTDADAFSSFFGNQLEQNHFLAWSDTIRDLKGVYGSATVQKAISDNFGRRVVNNLVERIDTIARGGGSVGQDYASKLMLPLYRYWVPSKIALNISSIIKQMFGSAAYMNKIPVTDFVRNMALANMANPEFRAFVKWARNTDYMKNRMAGGLDKDLIYLLNYTRDSKAYSPWSDALMGAATYPTRWADAWSSLHGGFAVYKYNLEQNRKSGMNDPEAREAARRAWMRATDETQQSGYLKDQNFFQSNQGTYRYLTAFLTNPIQVMNLQLQTINEVRYGHNKKAAAKKLGKQILVNHLIIPTLMQFTNDIIRAGFNVSDFADEVEFEDYLLAWLLGQFESVFLFGKLINGLGDYALDKALGRRAWLTSTISAIPLADDLSRDISAVSRMLDSDEELTEKDLMDGIKAVGDVGMLLGMADGRAGTVGAVLHAVGTQGKRLMKIINPDDKKR